MRIRLHFDWYDWWIGTCWSRVTQTLYVHPLPCVGVTIEFTANPARPSARERKERR